MEGKIVARRIQLDGQVQGVGFRPFVYRLAHRYSLPGSVCNQMGQVEVVVQGKEHRLSQFADALINEAPEIAEPRIVHNEQIEPGDWCHFEIRPSEQAGECSIRVPVDFFTCEDCLAELHDPNDRRYRYPFINCTQCGPRYTLIRSLPYDRPNTSMAEFVLCDECSKEYTDPLNRRFHAEPVACPKCGPSLHYESAGRAEGDALPPLVQAIQAMRKGEIVAVRGIGGYHLMCDARNEQAVTTLRTRKHRPEKPLAVMYSASRGGRGHNLDATVELSDAQWKRLQHPVRPIVLLRRRKTCDLAPSIAPGLNEIGVMLAYSPLHDILLGEFGGPLVATSGNQSGEPVITSRRMARQRLARVADGFLHHNRPIIRPADDSVLRFIAGRARTVRPGRGLAPLDLELPFSLPEPVIALGGHMKATVALAWGRRMVISPHIGEMESPRSLQVFEQVISDLQALYGVSAKRYLCDAHPGYVSHRWAQKQDLPVSTVWHHHAHASALVAEYADRMHSPMLVFTWDGVGLGPDQSLWGGEALLGQPGDWQRYAHWRPFKVPGGDTAGRAPWRSAAALCWTLGISLPQKDLAPGEALQLLHSAWEKNINAPLTTAVGRLFDGVSALLGLAKEVSYEGQGPMRLEAHAEGFTGASIPVPLHWCTKGESQLLDWAPLIEHMLNSELSTEQRAADWHESLSQVILQVAQQARAVHAVEQVGLSGGVFQNRRLAERALDLLQENGFDCLFPERLPTNDGGLCAGQILEHLYQTVD